MEVLSCGRTGADQPKAKAADSRRTPPTGARQHVGVTANNVGHVHDDCCKFVT